MTLPRRPVPLCILVLATLLAGCGGGGGGAAPGSGTGAGTGAGGGAAAPGDSPAGAPAASTGASTTSNSGGGGAGADDAIDTVDGLTAAIQRDHASAEWFGSIGSITSETLLGAPVLVVHITLSTADPDFEAVNRKRNDLATALREYEQAIAPNIAMLDADFGLWPVGSGGMGSVPMDQAFALPERPATAKAVRAWLDAVYGPGGLVTLGPDEAWLGALRDVRYEDPGWGTGKTLWLATTLPTYRSLDAKLLEKAVLTTGSPLLDTWYLDVKDGSGSAGGMGSAKDLPVGQNGFFYLP